MIKRYSKKWFLLFLGLLIIKATAPLMVHYLSLPSIATDLIYAVGFSLFIFWGVDKTIIHKWTKSFQSLLHYAAVYMLAAIAVDLTIAFGTLDKATLEKESWHKIILFFVVISLSYHLFMLVSINTVLFIYGKINRRTNFVQ